MHLNLDSNFEWAKDWNNNPTRCVHLTQNAYDIVLNTLENAAGAITGQLILYAIAVFGLRKNKK